MSISQRKMTGKARSYILQASMRINKQRLRQVIALSLAVIALSFNSVAFAETKSDTKARVNATSKSLNSDVSNAVTQSYNADTNVQVGMIVKLKDKEGTTVTPISSSEIAEMLGVVVPTNDATIVLTPEKIKKQQVLVATTGNFSVLVSNQNGPIKTGDYLTISALSGIAMKADENQTQVIGKATKDFSGTANVIGNVKLKDTIGRVSSVSIGRTVVDLRISHNPLF